MRFLALKSDYRLELRARSLRDDPRGGKFARGRELVANASLIIDATERIGLNPRTYGVTKFMGIITVLRREAIDRSPVARHV